MTATRAPEGHLQYLLTAYLFGDISPDGKREVEGHLAACAACRAELEELRAAKDLIREAVAPGQPGEAEYSFEAHRIERVLATSKKGGKGTLRAFGWVSLAAAALLLVAFLGVQMGTFSARGRPRGTSSETSSRFSAEQTVAAAPQRPAAPTALSPATRDLAAGMDNLREKEGALERRDEQRDYADARWGPRSSEAGERRRVPPSAEPARQTLLAEGPAAVGTEVGGKLLQDEIGEENKDGRSLAGAGGGVHGGTLGQLLRRDSNLRAERERSNVDALQEKLDDDGGTIGGRAGGSRELMDRKIGDFSSSQLAAETLYKTLDKAVPKTPPSTEEPPPASDEPARDAEKQVAQSLEIDGRQGWDISASPPANEANVRGFAYHRQLDPQLTYERFKARAVPVPPPDLDCEGLPPEEFRLHFGVNPFTDTRRDHLSTFGMDVDTASYARARALLRSGKLPERKTVRVEEFINSFPSPEPADPERVFSVFCDGGPSPFGTALEALLITVKARALRQREEKAAVLTFAVDTSGSMALPRRLELARAALSLLVDVLKPEDRVGLVAYNTHAYLVLPHTPAREKSRILGAIETLAPGGASNVEAGLDLAYRLADEAFEARAVNRVIICSDGVANAGARAPEEILRKVKVFSARGIYLSTVGFGMGPYNDALLETLADRGNGNYAYVDSLAKAQEVFHRNLPGTLHVLAQDAKVQVDFDPAVVSHYRLLGYENRDIADQDFRNDQVDAGEVGPGTTVSVLYEIRRHGAASAAGSGGSLGRVHVRYRDTGTGRAEEQDYPLPLGVLATSLRGTSERFRLLASVAEFAELLRGSYWARDGSFQNVLAVLGGLSAPFLGRPESRELRELVQRAQVLTLNHIFSR